MDSCKFLIPISINTDIAYCQKNLRHYIKVHQMVAAKLLLQKCPNEYLMELECEIIEIGRDQKRTIDVLRLCIENFLITLEKANAPIDRMQVNAHVSKQLSDFYKQNSETVKPMNVKRRLTEKELIDRYLIHYEMKKSKKYESSNLIAVDNTPIALHDSQSEDGNNETVNSQDKTEKMEVLVSPQDINFPIQPSSTNMKQQVSLLKPKAERISTNSLLKSNITAGNEVPIATISATQSIAPITVDTVDLPVTVPSPPTPPIVLKATPAMSNSRLNLLQALNKAKKASLQAPAPVIVPAPVVEKPEKIVEKREKVKIPSAKQIENLVSSNVLLSTSSASSSTASSVAGDTFEGPDLPEEEEEPTVLGKEAFLRVFGLCTHTYRNFLKQRRSERRRRNVTSTEKGDFHYGKLDILFDRQSAKPNKRSILYSPPSTRAAKKRARPVIATTSEKNRKTEPKSNSSSSSSLNEDNPMCIFCCKSNNDKMSECQSCNGWYHHNCHKDLNSASSSPSSSPPPPGETAANKAKQLCPDCVRQLKKAREQLHSQQRDKIYKTLKGENAKFKLDHKKLSGQLDDLKKRHDESKEALNKEKEQKLLLQQELESILRPIKLWTAEENSESSVGADGENSEEVDEKDEVQNKSLKRKSVATLDYDKNDSKKSHVGFTMVEATADCEKSDEFDDCKSFETESMKSMENEEIGGENVSEKEPARLSRASSKNVKEIIETRKIRTGRSSTR